MTSKSRAPEVDPDVADEATSDTGVSNYASTEDLAAVYDVMAEISERLDAVERVQRAAAAGRPGNDPVFLATTGRGGRRRESEGERQDKIVNENAQRHLMDRAGDGVPTQAITDGAPTAARQPDPDERGMEDPASPNFEEHGGEDQRSE